MKGGKSNHNRLLHNDMRPTNHIEQTDNRQSMDRGEEDGVKMKEKLILLARKEVHWLILLPRSRKSKYWKGNALPQQFLHPPIA